MNFQSDVYRGEYQLIKRVSGNVWECEYLAPDAAMLDEMIDHAIVEDENGWWGEFRGDLDAVQQEWDRRVARTGERFRVRLVSAAEFAAHF
jgi:hypothetical protein